MPTETRTADRLLTGRRYNPARGGHAPGHLRNAFCDWWEYHCYLDDREYDCDLDYLDDLVSVGDYGDRRPVRWLVGRLWNCTDIMPGDICNDLDLAPGSTYAQGVRRLRWIAQHF